MQRNDWSKNSNEEIQKAQLNRACVEPPLSDPPPPQENQNGLLKLFQAGFKQGPLKPQVPRLQSPTCPGPRQAERCRPLAARLRLGAKGLHHAERGPGRLQQAVLATARRSAGQRPRLARKANEGVGARSRFSFNVLKALKRLNYTTSRYFSWICCEGLRRKASKCSDVG